MNTNKAPDKIYVKEFDEGINQMWSSIKATETTAIAQHEYIRKNLVDETVKTAEDHAYFAGREKLRETLLEWAREKYEEYDRRLVGFPDDGTYWGQRNAFQQMLDKLNSM